MSPRHPTAPAPAPAPSQLPESNKLSTPPTQPNGPRLTPQLCFNTRVLRDFLRLSRSQLDDTIQTHLNSLVTPSRTRPFTATSTQTTTSNRSSNGGGRTPIAATECAQFLETVLFPTWHNRTQVLTYCSVVATSPDPDDPNLEAIAHENSVAAQRTVDERLDPYSARFWPREPRTQNLAAVLRNENAVEAIVRERTWRVIGERCEIGAGDVGSSSASSDRWQDEYDRWRRT